jgi:hypothetical protein
MVDSQNEVIKEWIELIPDSDRLFMRVHVELLRSGALRPNIFREQNGAMSVDWEKYSTPAESRARAAVPLQNGIVSLVAGKVRKVEGLTVGHEPLKKNRSHSGIRGLMQSGSLPAEEAKTMRRLKLFEIVGDRWEIHPSSDVTDKA